jgi:hypothetical protein
VVALLLGMASGKTTVENALEVSYEDSLTNQMTQKSYSWLFIYKRKFKLVHKNLHTNAYSGFIHSC